MEETNNVQEQPAVDEQAIHEQERARRTFIFVIAALVVAVVVGGVVLWLLVPRQTVQGGDIRYVRNPALESPSPSPLVTDPAQSGAAAPVQDPALASPVPGTAGQGLSALETMNAQSGGPAQAVPAVPQASQTQHQELVLIVDGESTVKTEGGVVRVGRSSSNPAATDAALQANETVAVPTPAAVLGQDQSAPVKPAARKSSTAAAPKPVKSSAAPKPQKAKALPTPATGEVSGSTFWIQIISSPNRDRVQQVQSDLSALGFRGRITTKNVDGKDFYRLRFGPYAKKEEASKFLDWVKMIKGFEQSYISRE